MKTHIIQLDASDDHISIRDKMSWAKSPRILLVWPVRERVAVRALDLILLQRHAASLGAQLGLATREAAIRRAAQELEIPVFSTIGEAERRRWSQKPEEKRFRRRAPRLVLRQVAAESRIPEARWRQTLAARGIFFSLAVLAILTLVTSLLPSATIRLRLESKQQTLTIPLSARSGVSRANPSGEVPLEKIVINASAEMEITASGQALTPSTKATGSVEFRNLTEASVTIPVGTVILTLDAVPVKFVTTRNVEVPAGIDQTADVPIEAEQPGSAGNLEAGSLQAIEGGLGLLLAATNPEAISGGADRRAAVLTESDMALAHAALLARLQQQALEDGENMISEGDLPLSIPIVDMKTLVEDANLLEGSTHTYSLSGEVVFLYVPADALIWLAGVIMNASLPEGYQAFPDTLSYEITSEPILAEDGSVQFEVQFERQIHRRIDSYTIIQSIRGRNPQNAKKQIESQMAFIQGSIIQMNPSWWPWLPLFPFRYEVSY